MRKINLSGIKHSKLLPIDSTHKNGRIYWNCVCDCGNITTVQSSKIRSGHTKSCGCLVGSEREFHGKSGEKIYRVWASIRDRCINKNCHQYERYGGRGITICKEWEESFVSFLDDMGYRPSDKHQIDRIDNDKGYCKENCHWVTRSTNQQNMRTSKRWFLDGVKYNSIPEASRKLKVSRTTILRWCDGGFNNGVKVNPKDNCYSEKVYK